MATSTVIKTISLVRLKPGVDRQRLRDEFLSTIAPAILEDSNTPLGMVANFEEGPPPGVTLYGDRSKTGEPTDMLLEMTFSSPESVNAVLTELAQRLGSLSLPTASYDITDHVVFDRQLIAGGKPSTGFKLMRGLYFFADLPDSAASRSWLNHEKLAASVHIGCCRYVRHWVNRPLTPGAPKVRGFSDLQFATIDDLANRYFDCERGRREIMQDISHFIERGMDRIYAREYVLR